MFIWLRHIAPGRLLACISLGLALVLGAVQPAAGGGPTPYIFKLPNGFPPPRIPDDNPMTLEKIELGRFLFYDTRMSGNETFSCASCHKQELAFTDGRKRSIGSTGEVHPRGAMSLANAVYNSTLTWANPNEDHLEEQAVGPMFGQDPVELGLTGREVELFARLRADARYRRLFAEAFPDEADPIDLAGITRALASFQRTLISGNSNYDRYFFGIDDEALTPSAIRGADLFFSTFFEKVECNHCHNAFNFTLSVDHNGLPVGNMAFHNTGLYNIDGHGAYPPDNVGIFKITEKPGDMGSFKAPTLRNIAVTAPYMHDGSVATLEEVIDHYAAGGRSTITNEPYTSMGSASPLRSNFVKGFQVTAQEKADLIAFLQGLTDEEFLTNPRFADPFVAPACPGDCNYDGHVTVDELITVTGIVLGDGSLARCINVDADGNGAVTLADLVRSVDLSLDGCP